MSKLFNTTTDVFSYALEQDFDFSSIIFSRTKEAFPYSELNIPVLNKPDLTKTIEINLLYRLEYLADALFEHKINDKTADLLTDLIVHFNAGTDLNKGLSFKQLAAETTLNWLKNGGCGSQVTNGIEELIKQNNRQTLELAVLIFEDFFYGYSEKNLYAAFQLLFQDGKLYKRKDRDKELIIFLNEVKSDYCDTKLNLIKLFFMPFDYTLTICYKHHFGLINYEETMIIDKICIIN